MIKAFFKAAGQLGDPRMNWVVWVSLASAITIFAAIWYGIFYLVTTTAIFEDTWLEFLSDVLGGFGAVVATIFLFPAVVTLVAGALLEYVARAVEARHYPDLPAPRDQPISEIVIYIVKFTGLIIVVNLIALPFYLVPLLGWALFWTVNGYLLGREYFELAAMRRLTVPQTRTLRKANAMRVFAAGLIIAVLMTVPFVNLLMPVIATAFMVHIFHGVNAAAE